MKRSCLVYLGAFVGLGILIGVALLSTVPPPPPGFYTPFIEKLATALGFGFGVSFFLTGAILFLRDSAERLRDRSRVGTNFTMLPMEGERTVAFGPVVAEGPLLESPFTHTRCAAYYYEVRCTSKGKSHSDVLVAWGFALTPSRVQTSWGSARLLSYTMIEENSPELKLPDIRRTAAAYFAATPLTATGLGAASFGYEAVKELHTDSDGTVRGDFGPLPADFVEGDYRLYEKLLIDREPVTAIGTWDSGLGGLRAKPGSEILSPVVVRKGPAEKARATLMKQAVGGIVGAMVLAGIGGGIAWYFVRTASELFY